MATEDDPLSAIEATCTTLGESLVRRFSCACCRRVWHLIDDERVWQALEVAERYAEADANLEELDNAQADVSDAIEERADEEWEAEAEAHFAYTAAYCAIASRLYATMAAWYALTRNMSNSDPDPHLAFPDRRKQSSWFWVGAAVESIARSEALRWLEDAKCTDPDVRGAAIASGDANRIAEHRGQLRILKRMASEAGRRGAQ